jgi:hypothetical protein
VHLHPWAKVDFPLMYHRTCIIFLWLIHGETQCNPWIVRFDFHWLRTHIHLIKAIHIILMQRLGLPPFWKRLFFFSSNIFYRGAPGFPVASKSWNSSQFIVRIKSNKIWMQIFSSKHIKFLSYFLLIACLVEWWSVCTSI